MLTKCDAPCADPRKADLMRPKPGVRRLSEPHRELIRMLARRAVEDFLREETEEEERTETDRTRDRAEGAAS
jgi:hypothetical protein